MYRKIKELSIDEDYFKRCYGEGYGEEGIAKKFNISVHAARMFIKKLQLKKHSYSRMGVKLREETKLKISNSHKGKKLSPEHREKVLKNLIYGKLGGENPNWKGGVHARKDGYVYFRNKQHPRSLANGYIKRAILVAEKKLGRMLSPLEVTHHINGIKDDDRPENIEVLSSREHNRITAKERWARGDYKKIILHPKKGD